MIFNLQMSNMRLQKDFAMLKKYITSENTKIFPYIENGKTFDDAFSDMTNFSVIIKGPPDSPYENGEFIFSINVPHDYPFKPPNVICKTNIYHPNISSSRVCVETLQQGWSPALGLQQLLMTIYAIMFSPNKHQGPVKTITPEDIEAYENLKKTALVQTSTKI